MKKHILYFIASIFLFSCSSSSDDCRESRDVSLLSEMYTVVYDELNDEYTTKILSKQLSIWGQGSDSLLYDNQSVSTFVAFLKDTENTTKIIVADTSSLMDTLTINHTNVEEFISLECGYVVSYTIDGISTTTNMIDSVIVLDKLVSTLGEKNLRIYFRN